MSFKGYRLWVMGQLDSNVQRPTSSMKMMDGCSFHARENTAATSLLASPNHLLCNVDVRTLMKHACHKGRTLVQRIRLTCEALKSSYQHVVAGLLQKEREIKNS
jgi:hypothetical protein